MEAAGRLPEIEFVLVGRWHDGAITRLRDVAGPNVVFTGHLGNDELDSYFPRAAVYVQPSLHEGFGLAVAEAR